MHNLRIVSSLALLLMLAASLDAAPQQRQTGRAATENIIVDVRANGHFMGTEFSTRRKPKIEIKAAGTAPFVELVIVRNNEYIFTTNPGTADIEMEYVDTNPVAGTNMYYVRLLQEDGEVVWASPIWIDYRR